MCIPHRIRFSFFIALATLIASGCSRSEPVGQNLPHARALQQIWMMYRGDKRSQGRVPRSLDDFKQYSVLHAAGYQALQRGDCVVLWGVNLAEVRDAASTVLAYEKEAPEKGGTVVMADGTVKHMSADELQAALKAK